MSASADARLITVAASAALAGAVIGYVVHGVNAANNKSSRYVRKSLKLLYFHIPGRAEAIRLTLALGDVPFKDIRLTREQWAELKPTTPFGQIPVLIVDGEMLAQSHAILRYAGELAGLYPADPWLAAKVDEVIDATEDMLQMLTRTVRLPEEERIPARQALVSGSLAVAWARFDALLAGREYIVGSRVTIADVQTFCMAAMLLSGWLDGISPDCLDPYTHVRAHYKRIASLPQVRKFYAQLPSEACTQLGKAGIDLRAYTPPADGP